MIENSIGRTDDGAGGLRFGATTLYQGRAVLRLVAGAAVGDADELHLIAEPPPLGRRAAGLEVGVVGMGAEDENAGDGHKLSCSWRRLPRRFYQSIPSFRYVCASVRTLLFSWTPKRLTILSRRRYSEEMKITQGSLP